jgi:hypothetical protein
LLNLVARIGHHNRFELTIWQSASISKGLFASLTPGLRSHNCDSTWARMVGDVQWITIMQLSKWQAVGVLLSAIWAVAAYATVLGSDYTTAQNQVEVTRSLCASLKKSSSSRAACKDEEQETWNRWTRLTLVKAFGAAFLPIPFAWVFFEMIGYWIEARARRAG